MARVLVLELDAVFAAVIEDCLLVAGHESQLTSDPAQAVSAATEGRADLLIMDLDLPGVSGLDIVRQLKRQSETRSLPILALSLKNASSDRIAALRAGVDDIVAKPCDPEELILRLDRMLGRGGTGAPPLSGDLASHPIWGLLQYIQQADKSGDLRIHGKRGSGEVRLQKGRVISAKWQSRAGGAQTDQLRDREALLAILDLKDGRFQLTTEAGGDEPAASAIRIPDVLIEAAWLEDQLGKRKAYVPATGAALESAASALPPIDEPLCELPIERIFERIGSRADVRLYDLMTEGAQAPSKVRLAVAWLAEQGAVKPARSDPAGDVMSTVEISSSVVLDVAVYNLLAAARDAGFDVSALPYLMLAEPEIWPELQKLPAAVPGYLRHETLRKLVERTGERQGGSASFTTDFGKLSLHVQPLTSAVSQQVEAIVPVCAGVLLWLDQAEEAVRIRRIVERLEAVNLPASGVLLATGPAARETAEQLIAGTAKWQISTHAPKSLIGVLRLLHPRVGSS